MTQSISAANMETLRALAGDSIETSGGLRMPVNKKAFGITLTAIVLVIVVIIIVIVVAKT